MKIIITTQFIAALSGTILAILTIFSDMDLMDGAIGALGLYFTLECCRMLLKHRTEKRD